MKMDIIKKCQDLFDKCEIIEIEKEYLGSIKGRNNEEYLIPVFGVISYNGFSFNEYVKECLSIKQEFSLLKEISKLKLKNLKFELIRLKNLYHNEEFSELYIHINEKIIEKKDKGFTNNKTSDDFKKIGYETLKTLLETIEVLSSTSPLVSEDSAYIDKIVDNLIDINFFSDEIEKDNLKKLIFKEKCTIPFEVELPAYCLKILIESLIYNKIWMSVTYTHIFKNYNFISKSVSLTAKSVSSSYTSASKVFSNSSFKSNETLVKSCFIK